MVVAGESPESWLKFRQSDSGKEKKKKKKKKKKKVKMNGKTKKERKKGKRCCNDASRRGLKVLVVDAAGWR